MNTGALSLDQAPPLSVPWRFFLTAPVFGFAAAVAMAWHGPDILASRWLPASAGVVHLLTLGFATMVMAGAMLQMLPVVAGSPVAFPGIVAWCLYVPLTVGTIALVTGFLAAAPGAFLVGAVLLGTFALVFVGAVAGSLLRARTAFATVNGMWAALIGFAVTATLGVLLAWSFGRGVFPLGFATWRDVHPLWGVAGWIGLLVVGVGYQVVPMFQLAPPYPAVLTRLLAPLALVGLAGASLLPGTWMPRLAASGTAAALCAFALTTLALQARRRRRLPDVSLDYWRVALGSLIAASLLFVLRPLWPLTEAARREVLVAILAIIGFAVSVIEGMLLKIVPFLAWFHLQARAGLAARVPHVKEFLPDASARWQFRTHGTAVAFMALAALSPLAFWPAVVTFGASQCILGWNLWRTAWRFRAEVARLVCAGPKHKPPPVGTQDCTDRGDPLRRIPD